jgi:hypothetical protein
VGWLASIGHAVCAALAAGAVRIADEDGGLTLIRSDGRHLAVAPHIVAELAQAGLLPPLPDALAEPAADDPVELAEREAIENEPPLPAPGTPERARLDDEQAALLRALRASALQRPPCFEGSADRPPPHGARCSCCKGRWWWYPRHPATDATGPSGDWRCAACRPPAHVQKDQIVRAET